MLQLATIDAIASPVSTRGDANQARTRAVTPIGTISPRPGRQTRSRPEVSPRRGLVAPIHAAALGANRRTGPRRAGASARSLVPAGTCPTEWRFLRRTAG